MTLGFSGRTVFITRCDEIGQTTARFLAGHGAKVALFDRAMDRLQSARGALEHDLPQAQLWFGVADLAQRAAITQVFGAAEAGLAPCDILINNDGPAQDENAFAEDAELLQDLSLKSVLHCSRAVLPRMVARRWGRIINVLSPESADPTAAAHHAAAKAGLIALSSALACEVGARNVTVNTVVPGLVATKALMQRADFEKAKARAVADAPLGRLCTPRDVAKTIAFFASSLGDGVSSQALDIAAGR